MTQEERIKEMIKKMGGNSGISSTIYVGTVKEISEDKTYVSVEISEGLIIEEVRLRSIIDEDKGVYIVPKVESKVLIIRIGGSDEYYCLGREKAERVIVKMESTSLEIDDSFITFNDNELNSYALDINKLKDKINALEQQINDLKSVFRNWSPVVQDGGAQLKLKVASWSATDIVKTTVDEIKDPKIKN